MAKKNNNGVAFAEVFAAEKKLVPSDALMYGTSWDDRNTTEIPLALQEKSVRGTISNRMKKNTDASKLEAEIQKSNPQTVDACALPHGCDTLKLSFTLKVLSGVQYPCACNNDEFGKLYTAAVEKYIEDTGFEELAIRYATNLANGRFFWRNRVGAEKLEIHVTVDGETKVFDSYDYALDDFDYDDPDVKEIAAVIAAALSGERPFALLTIDAYALVGDSQDVYPSEEMILVKEKGEKGKTLYSIDGVAAMHSQKIGNAIRCIDTWYPAFTEELCPIAAEPYGAVTTKGVAYRTPKDKTDFYTLFDKIGAGEEIDEEQIDYMMAVLVRGGVFGGKNEDSKGKKSNDEEAEE